MVKRSSLDPLEEARARVKLRYAKAKPVHPGPGTIGKAAMRLTRKALPKSGATLSRLKVQWPDIVGEQLARLCHPEKLTPAKGGRRLTLMVIPAAAGLVQHQSEMIRQRVSVAAGGDITAIKILQGQIGTAPRRAKPARVVPLTPEQRDALVASAQTIDDEKLRAALLALGEAVLTAEPEESTPDDDAPLPF
ncbi:MAG: DciA family protein [Hyphomonadaceae bacterium]|nr:DciA family protein [Hyphomonadaceae bacterium]